MLGENNQIIKKYQKRLKKLTEKFEEK